MFLPTNTRTPYAAIAQGEEEGGVFLAHTSFLLMNAAQACRLLCYLLHIRVEPTLLYLGPYCPCAAEVTGTDSKEGTISLFLETRFTDTAALSALGNLDVMRVFLSP